MLETLDNGSRSAWRGSPMSPLSADLFRYMAGWPTKIAAT